MGQAAPELSGERRGLRPRSRRTHEGRPSKGSREGQAADPASSPLPASEPGTSGPTMPPASRAPRPSSRPLRLHPTARWLSSGSRADWVSTSSKPACCSIPRGWARTRERHGAAACVLRRNGRLAARLSVDPEPAGALRVPAELRIPILGDVLYSVHDAFTDETLASLISPPLRRAQRVAGNVESRQRPGGGRLGGGSGESRTQPESRPLR